MSQFHISLTRERFAVVDETNYEWLSQWKWIAQWSPATHSYYACRWKVIDGKRRLEYMHRLIMGEPSADVDHHDRDTLNNRKGNLRLASQCDNQHNRGKQANNTSGFKGVYRVGHKWRAMIMVNSQRSHLGMFTTAAEAGAAYESAAIRLHGSFARV